MRLPVELHEALVMRGVRNYTQYPCVICGRDFTENEERYAIYAGNDRAAHEECWDKTPYSAYNPTLPAENGAPVNSEQVNIAVAKVLGLKLVKLDKPEVLDWFEPTLGKRVHIENWFYADLLGENVSGTWDCEANVREHTVVPDYCHDLNAALAAAISLNLVWILRNDDGGFVFELQDYDRDTHEPIWGEWGLGMFPAVEAIAAAICTAILQAHGVTVSEQEGGG